MASEMLTVTIVTELVDSSRATEHMKESSASQTAGLSAAPVPWFTLLFLLWDLRDGYRKYYSHSVFLFCTLRYSILSKSIKRSVKISTFDWLWTCLRQYGLIVLKLFLHFCWKVVIFISTDVLKVLQKKCIDFFLLMKIKAPEQPINEPSALIKTVCTTLEWCNMW